MSKNYLITGGESAYVQSLITKAIQQGNVVHALFTSPKQVPMSLLGKINLKFCFVDFERETNFEKSLPRMVDVIYHFHDSDADHKPNTRLFIGNALSSMILLDWAKKIGAKEFILGSTGAIYGGGEGQLSESDRPRPASFLISTRFIAEMISGFYQKTLSIKIMRIFFPYGPRVNQGLFFEILTSIKEDREVDLPYSTITPIYLEDLAEILARIPEAEGSMILNVCGSEVVDLADAAQEIGSVFGKSIRVADSPKQSLLGDNKKLVKLLDYSFKTTFSDGFRKMLEHART